MDRAHEPLGLVLRSPASPRSERRPEATRKDFELEVGAKAHFEDPSYYAQTYGGRVDDRRYYHALACQHDHVLEQGIGNGRIALAVARDGVEVTGIDHSRPMLDDLRAQLRNEPREVRRRVHLRQGDIRSVRLRRRFPLVICPFNAALHLYTRPDVERWLARVTEQLEPKGELVFDISMPVLEDLARDPSVPFRMPPFRHPSAGRVKYREHFDYDRVRQILFVSMYFQPKGDDPFMTPLAHRQFFPCEMEALLHYNGFEVRALYGDFDRGPLSQRSDVMVWHARRRRRR